MSLPASVIPKHLIRRYGAYFSVLLIAIVFFLYAYGLSDNPPGFYQDESAFAYNAYLIASTGASEFGVRWPLFFQNFTGPYTVYANPVCIYLLAALNVLFPPGIWLARLLSATAGFEAALLMGFLALRISSSRTICVVTGLTTVITPWLFEVSRLFFDSSFFPLALVLFLLSLHYACVRARWTWFDIARLGVTLGLLTYTYTIGRLLAPLLALGLLFFVVNKGRLMDVLRTWVAYGLTLVPLLIFNLRHPQALTSRFWQLSYIRTERTFQGVVFRFITRFFQDLSLARLLTTGDINPRHHVPGATGSMLAAPFILALIGLVVVLARRRRDPWWQFIIFGALASVIPGALTVDAFHTGRMIAYPIFLIVLTIPALEWLSEPSKENAQSSEAESAVKESRSEFVKGRPAISPRRAVLVGLLLAATMQAAYFQVKFWRLGPERGLFLDAAYKDVYDAATALPPRPIYLVDGQWGPGYIHALWYATLEGRSAAEFVHLDYGLSPPPGALVISSEQSCVKCEILFRNGQYSLYRKL